MRGPCSLFAVREEQQRPEGSTETHSPDAGCVAKGKRLGLSVPHFLACRMGTIPAPVAGRWADDIGGG